MKKQTIIRKVKKTAIKKKIKKSSSIKVESNKCFVACNIYSPEKKILDINLGLISAFVVAGIPLERETLIRPSDIYEDDPNREEFVFLFKKKHLEKMRKIEEDYFSGKIKVNAQVMSVSMILVLNIYMKAIDRRNNLTNKAKKFLNQKINSID